MLAEKLRRFVSVARVTVTVSEIRSKFVYITGEVKSPGVYPLLESTDVLQMIIKAGGLSPYARRKSIYVLRSAEGKQQRIPVNYVKLLRGDGDQNIQLQVGDTVVVP
jgi:polysaccharide export outer membrane protein